MSVSITLSREDWLTSAAAFILGEYLAPIYKDVRENISVRVSVGWPKGRSKVSSACLESWKSDEGHNEIFITPEINDSIRVLTLLTHELIHAIIDDSEAHNGDFKYIALRAGFERPLREPKASPSLVRVLQSYVELLGEIPHAKVSNGTLPKQTGRSLACRCSNAKCGFKFNASKTQILRMHAANGGHVPCLVCANIMELPASVFE